MGEGGKRRVLTRSSSAVCIWSVRIVSRSGQHVQVTGTLEATIRVTVAVTRTHYSGSLPTVVGRLLFAEQSAKKTKVRQAKTNHTSRTHTPTPTPARSACRSAGRLQYVRRPQQNARAHVGMCWLYAVDAADVVEGVWKSAVRILFLLD